MKDYKAFYEKAIEVLDAHNTQINEINAGYDLFITTFPNIDEQKKRLIWQASQESEVFLKMGALVCFCNCVFENRYDSGNSAIEGYQSFIEYYQFLSEEERLDAAYILALEVSRSIANYAYEEDECLLENGQNVTDIIDKYHSVNELLKQTGSENIENINLLIEEAIIEYCKIARTLPYYCYKFSQFDCFSRDEAKKLIGEIMKSSFCVTEQVHILVHNIVLICTSDWDEYLPVPKRACHTSYRGMSIYYELLDENKEELNKYMNI